MPLKIVLVQVYDADKFYDMLFDSFAKKTYSKESIVKYYKNSELPRLAVYPLGILALAAYARQKFGKKIEIQIIKIFQKTL